MTEKNDITPIPMPLTDISNLSEQERDYVHLALQSDFGTPLFKIRHFVGDSQITKYSKYKQLLLELRAREEALEQLLVSIEKAKAVIEQIKEKISKEENEANKKVLLWDLTSNINDLAKTERRLKMTYKERGYYITILNEMYQTGEAYLEDGTDLKQAMLDDELSEKLEAEYWTYRLGKQAALDLMTYGHIGSGNMDAISMLNEDQAAKTLQVALAYSHSLKTSIGMMEKNIIEAIENGTLKPNIKIEKQQTPKELE